MQFCYAFFCVVEVITPYILQTLLRVDSTGISVPQMTTDVLKLRPFPQYDLLNWTYHEGCTIIYISNTASVTEGMGPAFPSEHMRLHPFFGGTHVTYSLLFYIVFFFGNGVVCLFSTFEFGYPLSVLYLFVVDC